MRNVYAPKFPDDKHKGTTIPGAKVLGANWHKKKNVFDAIEKGISVSSFKKLEKAYVLDSPKLATVIKIPVRTIQSRTKNKERFNQFESERIFRTARILELAANLFEGDQEKGQHWLSQPAEAFNGRTPFEMCKTEMGCRDVEDLIHNLEHGVFV